MSPGRFVDVGADPNVLYVDASATTEGADGSSAAPFATIGAALEAAGQDVTLAIAPGKYWEYVAVSDRSSLRLLGACAEAVTIAPKTASPDLEATITVEATPTVVIDGITVAALGYGVRVVCPSTQGAQATVVHTRIDQAGDIGIAVGGPCENAVISHNRVASSRSAGIAIAGDADGLAPDNATIADNEVVEVAACTDCGIPLARGIATGAVSEVRVARNRVASFGRAAGIQVAEVSSASVVANRVEDLLGYAGLGIHTTQGADVEVWDNRVVRCEPDASLGLPFQAIGVDSQSQPATFDLRGNRVAEIQGAGVGIGVFGAGHTVSVIGNEVRGVASGLELTGELTVDENRLYDTGRAAKLTPGAMASFQRNEIWRSSASVESGRIDPLAVGIDSAKAKVVVQGNLFRGLTSEPVLVIDGHTSEPPIDVLDNAFENNTGWGLAIAGGRNALIQGNRFLRIREQAGDPNKDVAIVLLDGAEPALERADVIGNYTRGLGYGTALAVDLRSADHATVVEVSANTIVSPLQIAFAAKGGRDLSVHLLGNDLVDLGVRVKQAVSTTLIGNRLTGVFVAVEKQPEQAATLIEQNIGLGSDLRFIDCEGEIEVRDNELVAALGWGLLATSSTAVLTIEDNVIRDSLPLDIAGVGVVADGVHISGSPSEGLPTVLLRRNLLDANARFGVLLHGSFAIVEHNGYASNGTDCDGECDLVIQAEPREGAVKGADLDRATRPESLVGVVTEVDL